MTESGGPQSDPTSSFPPPGDASPPGSTPPDGPMAWEAPPAAPAAPEAAPPSGPPWARPSVRPTVEPLASSAPSSPGAPAPGPASGAPGAPWSTGAPGAPGVGAGPGAVGSYGGAGGYDSAGGYGAAGAYGGASAYGATSAYGAASAAAPGWYDAGNGTTMWWDGARWHAQAPGPAMAPYRPLAGLSVVVQAGLALSVVVSCFTIWNDSRRRAMVDGFLDGTVTFSELDAADDTAAVLAGAGLVVMALIIVALLVWRYRVQRNLRDALAVRSLEYSPGWAVGWWFVPIANLFKPKQAMNEAWLASDPSAPAWSPSGRRGKAPSLLSWWWAAWLLSNFTDGVSTSGSSTDVTLDSFRAAMSMSVFSELLSIVAALLLISIVRQIGTRQAQRARALGVQVA